MKFNLKNIWVLVLAIVLGYGSYVLGSCGIERTCEYYAFLNEYSFTVFDPTLTYLTAITPLTLILLFVNDDSFKRWLRFAKWWIPLSIFLIAISRTDSHSWMTLYPEATKENVAWLMGGLFTVISVLKIKGHSNTSPKKSRP